MTDLLTSAAAGAIQPDRPPAVLPGIDALQAAIIDRFQRGMDDADRQARRGRLPRTGFTHMTMALRCRDMREAGLVEGADEMWASWQKFADLVDAHVEGIQWERSVPDDRPSGLHDELDAYVHDQRERMSGFSKFEKGILDGILTDLELMLFDHPNRKLS